MGGWVGGGGWVSGREGWGGRERVGWAVGEDGEWGRVGSGEEWGSRSRLNPPLGLFGLSMSPRSASYRPKYA